MNKNIHTVITIIIAIIIILLGIYTNIGRFKW